MMGLFTLTKFWLVLKKDFILQFRRPVITAIELVLPLIVICSVIAFRHLLPIFQAKEQCFLTFDADQLQVPYTGDYTLYYTPNNRDTNRIASIIQSHLLGSVLIAKDSEELLINTATLNHTEVRSTGCFYNGGGIIFHSIDGPNISYTIRLRHETPTVQTSRRRWYTALRIARTNLPGPRVHDNAYLNEGFLHLEHIVGQALIQFVTGSWPKIPPLEVRQMPYKSFSEDVFLTSTTYILPVSFMISFMLSVGIFTKELVLEKETRLRETLKMNGVSNGILWMAWFIKQFLYLVIPVLLISVLVCVGGIFPKSNVGTVIVFMLTYQISLLCLCFFISIWFDNSQLGMIAGFILTFLTLLPHFFVPRLYEDIPFEYKVVLCLLPNSCMGLGITIISQLELSGEGLQFVDFTRQLSPDDPLNMFIVIGMLLFDSLIMMIIAWYINEWKPGRYGIPKKFYFPFLLSYWTGAKTCSLCANRSTVCPGSVHEPLEEEEEPDGVAHSDSSSTHEKRQTGQEVGIDVKRLMKKFKAKEYSKMEIKAVNDLYLQVYKGQITALLGHNGAGKTTTMSILTGLFPPDDGSALINGLNVVDDIDLIRRNLGICPQHNVLFDRLTVSEHLYFFARLRGISTKNITKSVDALLEQLNLKSHKNHRAKALSGGFKRKLCVAIALVGDPDILILDEPTSGMDHTSSLQTWALLEERRDQKKTILISTHSLDVTERADRIAIIVEGRLACSGRPSWLKKRYGVGYNLRIALTPRATPTVVRDLITRTIGCDPITVGTEIQALLPIEEVNKFQNLFNELENRTSELGIISFSVQENKMEDVFIKVGEGETKSWDTKIRQLSRIYSETDMNPPHPTILPRSPTDISLNSVDLNTWAFGPTTPSPLPPVETYSSEEEEEETPEEQPDGFPALDQSRKSYRKPAAIKRHIRSPSGVPSAIVEEEEEEEEEEDIGRIDRLMDGRPLTNKRVTILKQTGSGGPPSRDSVITRSRASSVTSIQGGNKFSIIDKIDLSINSDDESNGGKKKKRRILKLINLRNTISKLSPVTRKWLQQYRAMVVKRFLNYIRFHVGVVWQLLLPLSLVVFGLILVGTLGAHHPSDTSRLLSLRNSIATENFTFFQASFVDNSLSFDDLISSAGVSNVFNYTYDILDMKDGITTPTNISTCCEYSHQILDKFCASVNKNQLIETCGSSKVFGYRNCLRRCLNCCSATKTKLATCSNPRYQLIDGLVYPSLSDYCPVPPALAVEDYADPEGPLDDINNFITEHLLNLQETDEFFFKNVLGGFTLSKRTPTYTVCGCDTPSKGNNTSCLSGLAQIDFLNSLLQGTNNSTQCSSRLTNNIGGVVSVPMYCDDDPSFVNITLPNLDLPGLIDRLMSSLINTTTGSLCSDGDISSGASSFNCSSSMEDLSRYGCLLYRGSAIVCFDTTCSTDCNNGVSISKQYSCSNQNEESDSSVLTLWYNNEPYHLTPSILNELHNLYLHTNGYTNVSLTVYNHPLPRHPNSSIDAIGIDLVTFSVGFTSMFGFCFLLASFSLFIVQEKASKAKHLQLSTGLRLSAYWLGNITWDLITCLIPVTMTVIIFAISQIWIPQYSGTTLIAVALLFLMVCWAQIPSIYLLSLPFNDIYMAYSILFLLLFLLSLGFIIIIYFVGTLSGYTQLAEIFHYIFLINPSYGLATGLTDLYVNHLIRDVCMSSSVAMEICRYRNTEYAINSFRLKRPGIGTILLYFFFEGIIYFSLTLLFDHYEQIKQYVLRRKGISVQKLTKDDPSTDTRSMMTSQERPKTLNLSRERGGGGGLEMSRRLSMHRSPSMVSNFLGAQPSQAWSTKTKKSQITEDLSVRNERHKVNSMLQQPIMAIPHDQTVVIGKLTKCYDSSLLTQIKMAWKMEEESRPAVNNMNIILEEQQCFGLLGYNGAGKSTTFKMLTGEIAATAGTAIIDGCDISTQLREVQQRIGYCPQFDALIERLTGRELLTMFARLRGIPEKNIPNEVEAQIQNMQLKEHADKQCWKYSGGNRRKLSTAIALLGDPRVILLDEPTSGMDIKTRREFINTLHQIIERDKKTVIFSSHSMSECESLCNRIGIMINGEFRCIGLIEELRSLYGEQETKLTVRVEYCTSLPTFGLEETPFITEEDPLSTQPHIPQIPSLASQLSNYATTNPVTNIPHLQPVHFDDDNIGGIRSPSAYTRLKSVRKFVGRNLKSREQGQQRPALEEMLESVDGLSVEDAREDDDGQKEFENPYLQVVCSKIRQYFRGNKDVNLISVDKDQITFKLPKKDIPLSEIFGFMELLKNNPELHIVSYSVSQSTLEQVFCHFVKEQEREEREKLANKK